MAKIGNNSTIRTIIFFYPKHTIILLNAKDCLGNNHFQIDTNPVQKHSKKGEIPRFLVVAE